MDSPGKAQHCGMCVCVCKAVLTGLAPGKGCGKLALAFPRNCHFFLALCGTLVSPAPTCAEIVLGPDAHPGPATLHCITTDRSFLQTILSVLVRKMELSESHYGKPSLTPCI